MQIRNILRKNLILAITVATVGSSLFGTGVASYASDNSSVETTVYEEPTSGENASGDQELFSKELSDSFQAAAPAWTTIQSLSEVDPYNFVLNRSNIDINTLTTFDNADHFYVQSNTLTLGGKSLSIHAGVTEARDKYGNAKDGKYISGIFITGGWDEDGLGLDNSAKNLNSWKNLSGSLVLVFKGGAKGYGKSYDLQVTLKSISILKYKTTNNDYGNRIALLAGSEAGSKNNAAGAALQFNSFDGYSTHYSVVYSIGTYNKSTKKFTPVSSGNLAVGWYDLDQPGYRKDSNGDRKCEASATSGTEGVIVYSANKAYLFSDNELITGYNSSGHLYAFANGTDTNTDGYSSKTAAACLGDASLTSFCWSGTDCQTAITSIMVNNVTYPQKVYVSYQQEDGAWSDYSSAHNAELYLNQSDSWTVPDTFDSEIYDYACSLTNPKSAPVKGTIEQYSNCEKYNGKSASGTVDKATANNTWYVDVYRKPTTLSINVAEGEGTVTANYTDSSKNQEQSVAASNLSNNKFVKTYTGTAVNFTVVPEAGYEISSVMIDGKEVEYYSISASENSGRNIQTDYCDSYNSDYPGDHYVEVKFKKIKTLEQKVYVSYQQADGSWNSQADGNGNKNEYSLVNGDTVTYGSDYSFQAPKDLDDAYDHTCWINSDTTPSPKDITDNKNEGPAKVSVAATSDNTWYVSVYRKSFNVKTVLYVMNIDGKYPESLSEVLDSKTVYYGGTYKFDGNVSTDTYSIEGFADRLTASSSSVTIDQEPNGRNMSVKSSNVKSDLTFVVKLKRNSFVQTVKVSYQQTDGTWNSQADGKGGETYSTLTATSYWGAYYKWEKPDNWNLVSDVYDCSCWQLSDTQLDPGTVTDNKNTGSAANVTKDAPDGTQVLSDNTWYVNVYRKEFKVTGTVSHGTMSYNINGGEKKELDSSIAYNVFAGSSSNIYAVPESEYYYLQSVTQDGVVKRADSASSGSVLTNDQINGKNGYIFSWNNIMSDKTAVAVFAKKPVVAMKVVSGTTTKKIDGTVTAGGLLSTVRCAVSTTKPKNSDSSKTDPDVTKTFTSDYKNAVTVRYEPDEERYVKSVSIDGKSLEAFSENGGAYTFTADDMTTSHTVEVEFDTKEIKKKYPITIKYIDAYTDEEIKASDSVTITENEPGDAELTAPPDTITVGKEKTYYYLASSGTEKQNSITPLKYEGSVYYSQTGQTKAYIINKMPGEAVTITYYYGTKHKVHAIHKTEGGRVIGVEDVDRVYEGKSYTASPLDYSLGYSFKEIESCSDENASKDDATGQVKGTMGPDDVEIVYIYSDANKRWESDEFIRENKLQMAEYWGHEQKVYVAYQESDGTWGDYILTEDELIEDGKSYECNAPSIFDSSVYQTTCWVKDDTAPEAGSIEQENNSEGQAKIAVSSVTSDNIWYVNVYRRPYTKTVMVRKQNADGSWGPYSIYQTESCYYGQEYRISFNISDSDDYGIFCWSTKEGTDEKSLAVNVSTVKTWSGQAAKDDTWYVDVYRKDSLIPMSDTIRVTFDPDGGTVSESEREVTAYSSYGELPVPGKTGYSFVGWYTEKTGGDIVQSYTTVMTMEDHTLYAHWEKEAVILTDGTVLSWQQAVDGGYIAVSGGKLSAGENTKLIKSINIDDGITEITADTFKECTDLESVNIPESVTRIDGNVFNGCASLTKVVIPSKVTKIGNYTFQECTALESVTILGNITSIGAYAFRCCSSLKSLTLPDSVSTIGSYAFYQCTSLTGMNIPEGVTVIGAYTFYGCSSLTNVTLPESVTDIRDCAFDQCTSLTDVVLPETLNSLGEYAFRGTAITEIMVPEGVTVLNKAVFMSCTSLTNVSLPDTLTEIGASAFNYCTHLTAIDIPDSVTSVGTRAFQQCSRLTSVVIPEGITNIGAYTFYYCARLTSVTIPETVTSIGDYAFSTCQALTDITIPDSVTEIGEYAFYYCPQLKRIKIPDSVTVIERYAFYNCWRMTEVTLPEGLTSIGDYAFSKCSYLQRESTEDLKLPSTLKSIGNYAFSECARIANIDIPENVTVIGDNAFANCTKLATARVPSKTVLGEKAFPDTTTVTRY